MLLRLTLLLLLPLTTLAQRYPIQATVTLTPPYSPYLTDLTAPGAQRLALYLHVTDPTLSDYTCKLRLTIEGVGITLRTRPSFQPIAIPLQGGVPQIFYGEDLIDYFNPNNLDFAGLSRSAFAQTHRLPEGVYRFSIEVLDYNRGTVVSNKATATAWIILNDPPLLNLPRTNTKLAVFDPTNIPFTWTPRHTASPNAAFSTEYVFRLFELPATSREPSATSSQLLSAANQAVLSQLPLYETTLTQSQLVYGPGEPALIPGRWYAWQVQAIDTEGRDLFKNRGKSEVFVFQFGDPINMPGNVRKETANHQVISIRWDIPAQGDMPEQYRVLYKPTLSDHWYEDVTKERWHNIGYLKPSTTYDIKVRSEKGKQHSEYTAVIQAKTEDESTKFQCGEEGSLRPSIPADALFKLLPGDKIWKRNFTVIVTEAKGSNGYFEGMGWMPTRPLNGIHLRVKFSGQINQDMELFRGKIVTVMDNNPMSNIIDEMEKIGADRRKALLNDSTATQPADSTAVVQTSTTITYTIPGTIDSVYVQNGTIVVIDTEGNETTYEQKDKKTGEMIPITLVDEKENTWMVSKDGTVTSAGSAIQDVVTADRKDSPYYITIPNDTTKYRHNDELVFIKQKDKIKLSLNGHADSVISKLIWKIDKKEACKGEASCDVDLKNTGNLKVEIFNDTKSLLEIKVDVYKKPVLVFENNSNFTGDYGFDDAQQSELQKAGDYKKENYNGTDYHIPLLTLLSGQDVILQVDAKGLEAKAVKDKDFKITLKPTDNNITIDGQADLTIAYSQLKNKTSILVKASVGKINVDVDNPDYIIATDHKGDEIGKIAVVCGDRLRRDIVFIYVNRGAGYTNHSVDDLLNYLNYKSHNQFFREWTLKEIDSLDISKDYKKNSSMYTNSSTCLDSLQKLYQSKHTIKNDLHYFFLTNISVTNSTGGKVGGQAYRGGNFGAIYDGGDKEALAHEFGHLLRLLHPFDSGVSIRQIPQGTTKNYMDYIPKGRNMFYLYQMKKVK